MSVRFPVYVAGSEREAMEEPKESIEAYFARMREVFEEGLGRSGTEPTAARQDRVRRLGEA